MKQTKITFPLTIAGISTISASQILSHYVELPDLANGLLAGIGIGLLSMAILARKIRAAH